MNKRVFVISAIIGIIAIVISFVLFLTTEVGSFNLFGSEDKDCTPYNVFISKGEKDYSVEVEWSTKKKCAGFVLYGKDSNDIGLVAVDLVNDLESKKHEVVLDNILSSERYYFLINSEDQDYGINGIPLEFVLKDL